MSTAEFIAECEALYAGGKGNPWALAQVIWVCAQEGLLLPLWARKAYSEGMERVRCGEAAWTDVLGGALEKGEHRAALARAQRLMWPAHRIVTEISAGQARDEDMWDAARVQLRDETVEDVGLTTLKGYVREAELALTKLGMGSVR